MVCSISEVASNREQSPLLGETIMKAKHCFHGLLKDDACLMMFDSLKKNVSGFLQQSLAFPSMILH